MTNANQQAPDAKTQALLDSLPGLVGGIDHHILKHSGERQPFMLLVFSHQSVLHCTNADPQVAQAMTEAYVQALQAQKAEANGTDDTAVAE